MLSLSLHSPASIIIMASAPLYRVVGPALSSGQPDLVGDGMSGNVSPVSASLQSSQPTLLLIDLPASSPTLAQQLETGASQPGLLVLVDPDELDRVLPLGWAGATGWISPDDLAANLASVAFTTRRSEITRPAALGSDESGEDALIEPLSERELEVLRLLAQGLTNKDIA